MHLYSYIKTKDLKEKVSSVITVNQKVSSSNLYDFESLGVEGAGIYVLLPLYSNEILYGVLLCDLTEGVLVNGEFLGNQVSAAVKMINLLKTNEEIKRQRVAKVTGEGAGGDKTVKRQPVVKKIKVGPNDPCPCGSGKKYKKCHCQFDEKLKELQQEGHIIPSHDMIKTPEQIEKIKESGKINIAVLDYVAEHICAGISTEQIDLWVYEQTTHRGGIPAPLNYEGFPKSVCTSVNDQVCHGIPSADVILKDGDIINVDVSTIYKGYYSDSSRMFCIGEVSPEKKRLVEVTKQAIEEGLKQVRPWGHLGDMGQAINDYATANGYTVVREIGGHGVGLEFHEDPWVSFVSKKGTEMLMVPGMIFTIEPMINMGKADIFVDAENDWTIYTDDGMPSAQWEIQVLITEDGYEILSW